MVQLNLFNELAALPGEDTPSAIPGLKYLPGFISEREEKELIVAIDEGQWLNELKRRVQHFGFKYDYKKRNIDLSMQLGHLPAWMLPITHRLCKQNIFQFLPEQAIINEYLPGQGITQHIDCQPCFGDTIVSLSLGSTAVMEFKSHSGIKKSMFLERRSLVILQGDARYLWTHAIPARLKDDFNGNLVHRSRRISITFRNVILHQNSY